MVVQKLSTKTEYTRIEYIETPGNGSFGLNSTISRYIYNYGVCDFELDFTPLDEFENDTDYGDRPYFAFGSLDEREGITNRVPFINICARKGFPNCAIQIGTENTPIDAKLQYGKRQQITYINGVLTLPDGSTHNIDFSTVPRYSYIYGRIGASFEQDTITLDNPYTKMRLYRLKIYNRYNTYEFLPIINASGVPMLQYYSNSTAINPSIVSYSGSRCKAGPIIEEGE